MSNKTKKELEEQVKKLQEAFDKMYDITVVNQLNSTRIKSRAKEIKAELENK